MKTIKTPLETNVVILALGAESAGNFSIFHSGKIYFSESFGDLLEEENFAEFKKTGLKYLQAHKIKPDLVLTDLHPLYKTTVLGEELSKKFKADHIAVQHHLAHIFSAIGEKMLRTKNCKLKTALGIACDGTGYGSDGKIWGGEIFKLKVKSHKLKAERIGHLENQVLIGGDLAIREPARMLIGILNKFLPKKEVYNFVKKYYSKAQFEVLYNQLQQNFNCIETSSTGRILDAVSILLGFTGNIRNYKHEPIDLLEKNSTVSYSDLKPKIIKGPLFTPHQLSITHLFKYLIKNLHKDKRRLAATAQLYIAQGLYEIIKRCHPELDSGFNKKLGGIPDQVQNDIYLAGGIANNKTISSLLELKGVYANKKIPRGDAGLSFGQIIYYFLTYPRN